VLAAALVLSPAVPWLDGAARASPPDGGGATSGLRPGPLDAAFDAPGTTAGPTDHERLGTRLWGAPDLTVWLQDDLGAETFDVWPVVREGGGPVLESDGSAGAGDAGGDIGPSAEPIGHGRWAEHHWVELEDMAWSDIEHLPAARPGDGPDVVVLEESWSISAAEVLVDGEAPVPVVGLVVHSTMESLRSGATHSIGLLVVVEETSTIEEAIERVELLVDAGPRPGRADIGTDDSTRAMATNGQGAVDCHSEWLGKDGFECCGLSVVYGSDLAACHELFMWHLLICLGGGVTGGTACFLKCKPLLAAHPAAIVACIVLCASIVVVGVSLCIAGAMRRRNACELRAYAEYVRSLLNHGCPLTSLPARPR